MTDREQYTPGPAKGASGLPLRSMGTLVQWEPR